VPNDVDLLKQLQSGMSSLSTLAYPMTHAISSRWATGDGFGSPSHKGPSWKEERQKIGDTAAHRSTHKYSLEGYGDRPQQRLCSTWEMMDSVPYPSRSRSQGEHLITCIPLTVIVCPHDYLHKQHLQEHLRSSRPSVGLSVSQSTIMDPPRHGLVSVMFLKRRASRSLFGTRLNEMNEIFEVSDGDLLQLDLGLVRRFGRALWRY
jgi:hypothetical protein